MMTVNTKMEGDTALASADTQRRFLEPAIETMPRAELAQLQEKRLIDLVNYAWNNSAFYREHWSKAGVASGEISSIQDFLDRIPTMSKSDVQAYRDRTGDPYGGLLCVDPTELTSITSTSGTTSLPEPIPEIWSAAPPLPTISARDLWEIGVRPGDRVIVQTGTMRNFFDDFLHQLGVVPLFIDTWVGEGERVLQAIERYQVSYVQFMLPMVMEFERLESSYDMRAMLSSLKGAAFAGQPLGAVLTNKIRNDWGVDLYTYTSAGDTGTAWEGREHDGYYLWEDTVFAESHDPVTDEPAADGELGELIATDLDNWASPYIRFRSGDLVRMTWQPGAHGRTHSRIWVAGRKGDETVVAGKAILVSDVWEAVESIPELSDGIFQIVRAAEAMHRLRVRAGYASDRTNGRAELLARATTTLQDRLGVDVDIELFTSDDLLAKSTSVAKFARVVKA
jgi:phenylacetate-coenzyme A ligase PaaK-like adenylate-forming protein